MEVLTAPVGFLHSDCERIVVGALAQPVLAVTSLAYVAAGIAVLCWAMRMRALLAGTAGLVLMAVGAGSFAYHGPQPSWGSPPTTGRSSPRERCTPPVLPVAGARSGGRPGRRGPGSSRWDSPPTPQGALGRPLPTRQPLAVPRRLARGLRRCRRMGRPSHGAGPGRNGQPPANLMPSDLPSSVRHHLDSAPSSAASRPRSNHQPLPAFSPANRWHVECRRSHRRGAERTLTVA